MKKKNYKQKNKKLDRNETNYPAEESVTADGTNWESLEEMSSVDEKIETETLEANPAEAETGDMESQEEDSMKAEIEDIPEPKAGKGKRKKPNKEKASGKSHSVLLKIMGITAAVAIIIVGGTMLYFNIYYNNRWYKNTYINDVDVSGQTLEESKKTILSKLEGYGLTISGRDEGKLTISGNDIDFELKINKEFDELFDNAHDSSPLFSGKNELTVNYDVDYDEEKLEKLVKKSDMVSGSEDYEIVKPKSAYVKYSSEKLQYECQKEVMGNTIIKSALLAGVKDALSKGETTLDINDTAEKPSSHVVKDIYKAPKVTSDSPELQKQLAACNSTALRFVVWNMGKGVTEQITPKEISSWIRYREGKVKYDWDAVSDWVEEFCKKYKTVGIDRKVKMHNGKTVTVKGGDYGWQIDYEKTLKQAKKALQADVDKQAIEAYIQNPSEENKAALTSRRKVQYANTAYRKDYEDFQYDWDPKNYIEISLSKQKVYVIRDGKVKFSCRTISGRPTPERATKKGAYFIKEHDRFRILKGDDYRTPVNNWVRITWSGTGFHSATWQPWSRWTKDFYKTRGSHGCLNLSMEDSEKIYKLAQYREAVFIY